MKQVLFFSFWSSGSYAQGAIKEKKEMKKKRKLDP